MNQLQGTVIKGHQRGKQLGFPTANTALTTSVPEGIYISQTTLQEKRYNSITFIGAAKTFEQTEVLAETYILDFNQDIYGAEVTIELISKLRDNMKFTSAEELIKQMQRDEDQARNYFSSLPDGA